MYLRKCGANKYVFQINMSCLHRGPYVQRGRGIGGVLSSMFKSVVPALQVFGKNLLASPTTQDILKTAKESSLQAGLNIAKDTLRGKNFGESFKENVSTAKKAVTDSLMSALDKNKVPSGGDTVRRKRKHVEKLSVVAKVKRNSKKKKRYEDLFEEDFE